MSQIKLLHSGGNGAILSSPAANPSSDVTLKLPSTTGSAGQVLKVASANHSSTNAELEFASDVGGKVLQHLTTSSSTTVSVTTETDLLTLSITPSSTSNKILCLFTGAIQSVPSGSSYASIRLYRGTSSGTMIQRTIEGVTANSYTMFTHNIHELDSPNTTSSQQYTITLNKNSGNTASSTTDGQMYRLTLMELGA